MLMTWNEKKAMPRRWRPMITRLMGSTQRGSFWGRALTSSGQVSVLHLPRVVEQVIGAVPDHERDGPGSRRRPSCVVIADRGAERVAVCTERGRVSIRVGRSEHADFSREVTHLGGVDVPDDLVAFATSSARALTQLGGYAKGCCIEVGPASLQQRDLPLAFGLAH